MTERNGKGLACVVCGCRKSRVLTTRSTGLQTVRFRKCTDCGREFTTTERPNSVIRPHTDATPLNARNLDR